MSALPTSSLPVSPQEAARELLRRRKARRSLIDFTGYTYPGYRAGRFHHVLAGVLDRVLTGEIKRLMVFAPPQFGKSELVSRRFPAYTFGRDPSLRVIGASYNLSLAASMNRDVQKIIADDPYRRLFPDTRISSKGDKGDAVRNAGEFEIIGQPGTYRAAGVGQGIVGRSADLIVIDDPIAGADQAYSPAYRESLWNWYCTEASTRQSPRCAIVLMHQRWHEDDLAGRLLKRAADDPKADQWEVVRFPALAYPKSSPLRSPLDWREEGEPLWPERYSREFIEARKATMSPFQYAAVYDQNPQPLEGAYFREEWFQRWEDTGHYSWRLGGRIVLISECRVLLVVDPAASEKQTADDTAIGAFALTPTGDLLVLEVVEAHLAIEKISAAVLAMAQRWKAAVVLYEDTGFQVALARECRRTPGMPPVREVSPQSRSKLVRATEAINRCASRQVYLPESAPWVAGFVDECIRFTGREGGKDGAVDCLAYAALMQSRKLDQGKATVPTVMGG